MKNLLLFISAFLLIYTPTSSQEPSKLTASEIFEKIQKLNFLGTALYIAAHPDDENTRLLSYLSNKVKARTGYLSLTRGDGGQNLIGSEIRELLGVIRTQELLAARKIDGGEQLFTRANDFGYSKHPDETLEIWNKDEVLSDVVWAIRTFKPDVIINRFDHRTPGTTHGHHTSSAMLSTEAFDLVDDETQFSEQLQYTSTWKPIRLFFNTSSWFYSSYQQFEESSKNFTKIDVGVYYPLKGVSNNEIAALASSQHLCQGFGRLTTRGSQPEYLSFLKGEEPKDKNNLFSGINTTWNRIEGGGEVGNILYEIEENFNFNNPSQHIAQLLEAYLFIKELKDDHWRSVKTKEIKTIIEACLGLYIEASAISSTSVPNSEIVINFELINRSSFPIELISIQPNTTSSKIYKGLSLNENIKQTFKETIILENVNYTAPYWLKEKPSLGMYNVKNQTLIGLPETPRAVTVTFNLVLNYTPITFTKNVVRRYAESDKGEIYAPFEIVPRVTTKLMDKVLLFSDTIAKQVWVEVKAGTNFVTGEVSLEAPEGWQVSPSKIPFSIAQKNDKEKVAFLVSPSKNESEGMLKAIAISKEKKYTKELIEINYNHIPKQTVLKNAEAKVVRLEIKKKGTNIGYIKGAGDEIPESLRQIGYNVFLLQPEEINLENLQKFDAVVLGIRAYNVVDKLKFKQKHLVAYVKEGGNLVVQYNTSRGVDVQAPYPLKLSRDRVTDEASEVTILAPNHPILNEPNVITENDFKGWLQERGLYFPNVWSDQYTPLLAMKDKGETLKLGSLLVAKYGKGNYIYTGLSFFRELPAGVSGAYKLFANLLSAEHK